MPISLQFDSISTSPTGFRHDGDCPAQPINRIGGRPNSFNKNVKVFFLGAGGRERQSNPNIWNLHEALAKAGIKSVYYESPGTAHEWLTWRRHLREFAPLLFKD